MQAIDLKSIILFSKLSTGSHHSYRFYIKEKRKT